MAIKVFGDLRDAEKELKIAKDICGKSLKGLAILEDDGIIEGQNVARDLHVPTNSKFIVYRYIGKMNVKEIWDTTPFSKRDIVQIGIEIVDSLKNLHSTGYIHADVKLDNFMVNAQNQVFLIDYGNA